MTVDAVVKIGGGLLAHPPVWETALAAVAAASCECRLLIVPGGGPFADAVREVDRRHTLSADAAHWMAVLGMDQYGHLLASRIARAALVTDRHEIDRTLRAGRLPVLLASHWMRQADPLPHVWDVTSDSIAAWVATELAVPRLVLVKPPGAAGRADVVDPWFERVLARSTMCSIVPADRVEELRSALRG